MKAPQLAEVIQEKTSSQRPPLDRWKDGSRIHIVTGMSVLEAKNLVKTLDDGSFNSERAQMVNPVSRDAVDRAREDREKATRNMRAVPPPARSPRAPPEQAKCSCSFERLVTLIFLLTVLGLQLAVFVRMDRWPG